MTLDGDRTVPGPRTATGDRPLDQAAAALLRREPHETVEDWLWRRGSELTTVHVADLDRTGLLGHPQGHRLRGLFARTGPGGSPERHRAEERLSLL
ncbi:GPP34 family phosphoprotein [Streptomyces carpinensis]|uniref:GPP34 family phosphoprotein n=1 Tax=Streptomyces carpinensis TaxID=66369 RepID=UPI003CC5C727